MNDLLFQVNIFETEITMLLDQGESITIDELENIHDNADIVDFIGERYGFENRYSTPENQKLLKEALKKIYISTGDAQSKSLTKNGLVYLERVLFSIIIEEAYNYSIYLESLNSNKENRHIE